MPFSKSDLAVSSSEGGLDLTKQLSVPGSFGSKLAPTDKEFDAPPQDLRMDLLIIPSKGEAKVQRWDADLKPAIFPLLSLPNRAGLWEE